MKIYAAVDECEGAFVGNLKEILEWQEDLGVPFLRCTYHEVGDEIDYETVMEEYTK